MRNKILALILIALLIMAVWAIILMVVISREDAERIRESDFRSGFDNWLNSEAQCNDSDAEKLLLSSVAPLISESVRRTNEMFQLLSQKERDGTLTVGETQYYLSNSSRVKDRSVLSGIESNSDDMLILRCEDNGFEFMYGRYSALTSFYPLPETYCEDFVSYYIGGRSSWNSIKWSFYRSLIGTNQLDPFMATMSAARERDFDVRQAARDEVLARPANQASSSNIEWVIDQAYLKLKCSLN